MEGKVFETRYVWNSLFSRFVDGLAEINILGWNWFNLNCEGIAPLFFNFRCDSDKPDAILSLFPWKL